MNFFPFKAPPPYSDLESANTEIRRLQKVVFEERQKWVKKLEKDELTRRSLTGTIRKLEAELKALKVK